ncbi:mechanosensitive ion channel protein MscS [Pontibacillus halophilus JSM 076056 = DSM 19796]|uniref:Mechanosensitive ion channel protein MscS n=1 Tax=Pontibacillus halophilus JSM 076056 = DSM 19796 TaxID=1385510 RepID=A0A0A5IAX2_9BACI|nr:mechanosensitive ion channel family protein [Pontibacillus halophilus]KGX92977.1 mechanosensitive ion channel protein MscS [Pontibacillus halophilus JSM 076056 = DSM 19796]
MSEIWSQLSSILSHDIAVAIYVVTGTYVLVRVIRRSIRSFFDRTDFIEERKEKTLESMINSLVSYTATFGIIVYLLSVAGVPIAQMLAGAGVLGIVIGFGAQSLIRDLLSGVFFLYEKQLHKGDFVSINDQFIGTVEEIGLRFLKVREWSGKLLTISNGQITTIQNYNIGHMRVIEKVTVSFKEEPNRIFQLLEEICDTLNEQLTPYLKKDLKDDPLQPFQVYGMTSLNQEHRGYEYTIIGLTDDLTYWTAGKEARRIIAQRLYEEEIEMSLQHIDIPTKKES